MQPMNYIVLDMEWNQPHHTSCIITTPVTLYGEIIQIGAVKLDENYHALDTFKIMVSPAYYKKMHKTVARLTGIKTEALQFGLPFPVAIKQFQAWCGEDFSFLTWGPDDIGILHDNLTLHGMDASWIPATYNIQLIFSEQITKDPRQSSLSRAMEMLGEKALEAHDALNDALNTVCVCSHLDMVKGLAEYGSTKNKIVDFGIPFCSHKESAKSYESREEALSDSDLLEFCCPVCGSKVACVDVVRQNYQKFIAIAHCQNGEEMFVRFKIKRLDAESIRINRVIYEIDDEKMAYYLEKKRKNEEAYAAYCQRLICTG